MQFLRRAARPVRLPPRPDAADAQQRAHRHRDRRGLRSCPPALDVGLARPRLLRLGQPQRQGDLPALPRLVRRQPDLAVAAPAGRRGVALRRGDRRRRRGPGQGARRTPTTATSGSPPSCSKHAVFADPDRRGGQGARWPTSTSSSATGRRTPPGATSTSAGAHELREGIQRTRDRRPRRRHGGGTDRRAALRHPRDPGRRPARRPSTRSSSTGTSPTATRRSGSSLSNGALIQTPNPRSQLDADLTLTLTKPQLLGLMAGHGLDGHRPHRRPGRPADAARPARHPGPGVRDRDPLSPCPEVSLSWAG